VPGEGTGSDYTIHTLVFILSAAPTGFSGFLEQQEEGSSSDKVIREVLPDISGISLPIRFSRLS